MAEEVVSTIPYSCSFPDADANPNDWAVLTHSTSENTEVTLAPRRSQLLQRAKRLHLQRTLLNPKATVNVPDQRTEQEEADLERTTSEAPAEEDVGKLTKHEEVSGEAEEDVDSEDLSEKTNASSREEGKGQQKIPTAAIRNPLEKMALPVVAEKGPREALMEHNEAQVRDLIQIKGLAPISKEKKKSKRRDSSRRSSPSRRQKLKGETGEQSLDGSDTTNKKSDRDGSKKNNRERGETTDEHTQQRSARRRSTRTRRRPSDKKKPESGTGTQEKTEGRTGARRSRRVSKSLERIKDKCSTKLKRHKSMSQISALDAKTIGAVSPLWDLVRHKLSSPKQPRQKRRTSMPTVLLGDEDISSSGPTLATVQEKETDSAALAAAASAIAASISTASTATSSLALLLPTTDQELAQVLAQSIQASAEAVAAASRVAALLAQKQEQAVSEE